MTDTLAADIEEVRAAAAVLKAAIDRHLAAVEAREGEGDADVQQTYSELHDAAEHYDDLLFEIYDEVTPFVLSEPPEEPVSEISGTDRQDEVGWVSMLARWDFEVVDRDRLLAGGHAAETAFSAGNSGNSSEPDSADDLDGVGSVPPLSTAFSQLVDAYGRDELAARSSEFGLAAQGVTTWIMDADPMSDESWMDAAFAGVDEDRLIYRLDEVYDDEVDDEELVIE